MLETINKEYVNDILTLRYYRFLDSPVTELTYKDLEPTQSDPEGVSIESNLRNDLTTKLADKEEICISLSSGVDSSLLLALIRDMFPKKKITCITQVGIKDETQRVEELAHKFNAEFISIPQPSIILDIPTMVSMVREPRWNAYQYNVIKEAKTHGNILITGDGADEILGGYIFRYKQFLKEQDYLKCHINDWIDDQTELIPSFRWQDYTDFRFFDLDVKEPLDYVFLKDFNGKLRCDFVPTTQIISKYYGIETYSPFLHERVIHDSTHLPVDEKYKKSVGKIPLRYISERLGVKQSIEKIAYSLDVVKDFEINGKIIMDEILDEALPIYKLGLVNHSWVVKHRDERDYRSVNKFLQLYCLQEWLNVY